MQTRGSLLAFDLLSTDPGLRRSRSSTDNTVRIQRHATALIYADKQPINVQIYLLKRLLIKYICQHTNEF